MRLIATVRASSRGSLMQVIKTGIAVAVAWVVCNLALGQPIPTFAAIAALLVVQPSVNQSLAKGLERSLGVILGVILAYGAGVLFGESSWIVLAIITVSLLLAWVLRLSPGSATQIPISAMLVLAVGATTPNYAVYRIIETIIGAAVGLIINALVVPPVLLTPAQQAVQRLAAETAYRMQVLSLALQVPQVQGELDRILAEARGLRPIEAKANVALSRAAESLMMNPRSAKNRAILAREKKFMTSLGIIVTRVIGMTRALHDRYEPALFEDPMVLSIAEEVESAAHDLQLLAGVPLTYSRVDSANASPEEEQMLSAPLPVLAPHPHHWILVGSLMEDLRRVREEILGGRG